MMIQKNEKKQKILQKPFNLNQKLNQLYEILHLYISEYSNPYPSITEVETGSSRK